MNFPNILPCPFCGGTKLNIDVGIVKDKQGYLPKRVMCMTCFAAGPWVQRCGKLPSDYERIQFHWDNRK